MKSPALLVAISLGANAALLGLLYARPTLAPPMVRSWITGVHAADARPAARRVVRATASPSKRWASLATDDLSTLIQRLRAAGFPASIIREIVRADIAARYDAKMRAIFDPDPN